MVLLIRNHSDIKLSLQKTDHLYIAVATSEAIAADIITSTQHAPGISNVATVLMELTKHTISTAEFRIIVEVTPRTMLIVFKFINSPSLHMNQVILLLIILLIYQYSFQKKQ